MLLEFLKKYKIVFLIMALMWIDWGAGHYYKLYLAPYNCEYTEVYDLQANYIYFLWNYCMQTSVWAALYLIVLWYFNEWYKKAVLTFLVGWLWYCGLAIMRQYFKAYDGDPNDYLYLMIGVLILILQIAIPFNCKKKTNDQEKTIHGRTNSNLE